MHCLTLLWYLNLRGFFAFRVIVSDNKLLKVGINPLMQRKVQIL